MKNLLTLLGVMSVAAAWAQSTTTILFSELPGQPVAGLTFQGVTFSFQINGTNSGDAHFNSGGPGTLTYIADPSLEGNTSGVLGFHFTVPMSKISFGVAVASTGILNPGITVKLYDSNLNQIDKIPLTLRPISPYVFSEGLFSTDQGSVSHVLIYFNTSGPRFVVDNLTFTTAPVPRPQLQILRQNNLVVLSWPTNAAGFQLESRTNISNSNWTSLTNIPVTVGNQTVVTNRSNPDSAFFRLRKL